MSLSSKSRLNLYPETMPVLKRVYNVGGFRINVLTNESYFLGLLDNCLGRSSAQRKTKGVFSVTLKISSRPFAFASDHSDKNIIHFENSIINISQRIIYSYYPSFPAAEQVGILFSPLWCLLIHLDYYPIHGALIKSNSSFIALLGPGGSGKSTLSSVSSMYGFSLICDDHFFVKNIEKSIKIFPFVKAIKVKNMHNKSSLNLANLKISLGKAYFLAKRLVIVFPRYSIKGRMRLCPVSKKSGVLKLIGDNLIFKTWQPDNKKDKMKMLDFIFQLEKKSSFYELTYNDSNIFSGGLKILHNIKKQT